MGFDRIGVVGCGLMGSGIAQVCAMAGYPTRVREISDDLLERGLASIRGSLKRLAAKDKIGEGDVETALRRLQGTTNLEDLADCNLIVEAVPEELEIKRQAFQRLDAVCSRDAVFTSNTSSLSITELMMASGRPEKFAGLHFFNPVPVMKLVEIVETLAVQRGVIEDLMAFAQSLGKSPVKCQDRTGFLVNRLLVPYLLDAIRAYEQGTGSLEDIDRAMKLGCGHPMGPFTLLDFVGLDTTYHIANIMFEEFKEARFSPPPLLKRMVLAGRLGRKAGVGFFDYRGDEND